MSRQDIDKVFRSVDRLFQRVINEGGGWKYHRAVRGADAPFIKRPGKRGNLLHRKGCPCPSCNRGPRTRRRRK